MIARPRLIRNDEGATAIEYGLLAALIAVAAILSMKDVGTKLIGIYANVATAITSVVP
jgi:pilus assembly protein Flp/PilA